MKTDRELAEKVTAYFPAPPEVVVTWIEQIRAQERQRGNTDISLEQIESILREEYAGLARSRTRMLGHDAGVEPAPEELVSTPSESNRFAFSREDVVALRTAARELELADVGRLARSLKSIADRVELLVGGGKASR
ncbi:MAG TPA: hypothetical protein VFL93_00975 [Longimicrobiaceae bacterium]|nr:hypothetical protein [Longimicrobiaceae bacterium]